MPSKAAPAYNPAPKSAHYEFGGPLGALGVTLAVPFFSYWLPFAAENGFSLGNFLEYHRAGWRAMEDPAWWKSLWSAEAMIVYLAWYAWCVVCALALPGKEEKGVELRNGQRLTYKMNAFATLVVTMAAIAGWTAVYGIDALLYIPHHWAQLVTATTLFSFALAFFVYGQSIVPELFPKAFEPPMLALGGNTGNRLYDWFIGRVLNPRIGSFDIKAFNEMRPGLILWVVFDLAFVAWQYERIGRVTDSMILTVAFHAWYVFDAEFNESNILTTMDITTDGFGFMLSVGDLLWVPYTYSYTAYFLALHPLDLGVSGCAGVLAVQFLGYYIFRTSNNEKNEFRLGRNPKNLTSFQTERGTRLLTSGWWGRSRHPNYMGDWIMAWAWCLPTGFQSPLPYFYVIYFAILLVHRQTRDDEACAQKYGKDWDKYKRLVPSRIIPHVY
ncbi:delta(14)-sterol reductase [Rhodotorula paludigena]|uniref:delta(14)-sterol reductase n=1 Tax=Rhodotorula paludigena TaxID=86838 RepID=UPI0031753E32